MGWVRVSLGIVFLCCLATLASAEPAISNNNYYRPNSKPPSTGMKRVWEFFGFGAERPPKGFVTQMTPSGPCFQPTTTTPNPVGPIPLCPLSPMPTGPYPDVQNPGGNPNPFIPIQGQNVGPPLQPGGDIYPSLIPGPGQLPFGPGPYPGPSPQPGSGDIIPGPGPQPGQYPPPGPDQYPPGPGQYPPGPGQFPPGPGQNPFGTGPGQVGPGPYPGPGPLPQPGPGDIIPGPGQQPGQYPPPGPDQYPPGPGQYPPGPGQFPPGPGQNPFGPGQNPFGPGQQPGGDPIPPTILPPPGPGPEVPQELPPPVFVPTEPPPVFPPQVNPPPFVPGPGVNPTFIPPGHVHVIGGDVPIDSGNPYPGPGPFPGPGAYPGQGLYPGPGPYPSGDASTNLASVGGCAGVPPGPFIPPSFFLPDSYLQQQRFRNQCRAPPIDLPLCSMIEVLQQLRLRTITTLIQQAGLEQLFMTSAKFSFFAPVDQAFDKLPDWVMQSLRDDVKLLRTFILNHFVRDTVSLSSIGNEYRVMNARAGGHRLRVNVYQQDTDSRAYTIDGSKILLGDIDTLNEGKLHIVDQVLFPNPPRSHADYISETPDFKQFFAAVLESGLMPLFQDRDSPLTVFIPYNPAFKVFDYNSIAGNPAAIQNFINYHVVNGTHYSAGLRNGQYLSTNYFKDIKIGVASDGFTQYMTLVNGRIRILKPDIKLVNGVAHIIEHCLTYSREFLFDTEINEFSMDFGQVKRTMKLNKKELEKEFAKE